MLVFNRSTPPRGTLSPSPENRLELASFCIVSISPPRPGPGQTMCSSGCYDAVEQLSLESFYPAVPFPSCDLGFPPSLSNDNKQGLFPGQLLLRSGPVGHRLHKVTAPHRSSLTWSSISPKMGQSQTDRQKVLILSNIIFGALSSCARAYESEMLRNVDRTVYSGLMNKHIVKHIVKPSVLLTPSVL